MVMEPSGKPGQKRPWWPCLNCQSLPDVIPTLYEPNSRMFVKNVDNV